MTKTKRRWNLLTPYEYLFYWVYAGQRKISRYVTPQKQMLVAFVATYLFLFINANTLFICFQIISGKRILLENIYSMVLTAIIALINYFIFSYEKETMPSLIARFHSESQADRKRRTIFCWLYVVGSLLTFFVSVMVQNSVLGK